MKYLLPVVCLALIACKEEKVVHYVVPKEERVAQAMPQQAAPSSANLAAQTEGFKTPSWQVPPHWEEKPLGQLRKGSFSVKSNDQEIDISVLAFPGDVGGLLANINRWAQQVASPPLTEKDVAHLEKVTISGVPGVIVELQGPQQSTLGAIVSLNSHSWFFKMMGDPKLINQERPNFLNFLETVKFEE